MGDGIILKNEQRGRIVQQFFPTITRFFFRNRSSERRFFHLLSEATQEHKVSWFFQEDRIAIHTQHRVCSPLEFLVWHATGRFGNSSLREASIVLQIPLPFVEAIEQACNEPYSRFDRIDRLRKRILEHLRIHESTTGEYV